VRNVGCCYCGRENYWPSGEMLNSKFGFKLVLVINIWWSNFNVKCSNCFCSEKYSLNCLSDQKYQLNYHGGEKYWSNEEISCSKSGFEPILIFFSWWPSFNPTIETILVASQLNCLNEKNVHWIVRCDGDKC